MHYAVKVSPSGVTATLVVERFLFVVQIPGQMAGYKLPTLHLAALAGEMS